MKKIAILSLVSFPLVTVSAIAGTGEIKGEKAICTKVYSLDKKQFKSMPCTYSGTVGASMFYGIMSLKYKLSNGDIYNIINNIWFEQDANGDYIYKESDISINDTPAEVIYLQPKTLKKIPKSKLNNPTNSNSLQCFKAINSSQYFCVPYERYY